MASLAHLCRRHPGLAWLGVVALLTGLIGIAGVESMDGGVGSILFVLYAVIAAPFLIVGRLGVALVNWAPMPVQVGVVVILAVALAALLDDPLRRLLDRVRSRNRGQG